MKVIGIIPSRYGSTRFQGKPLTLISGKPMIQWVYERVKPSKRITDVFVATDDQRIFDAVRSFGGNAVMTSLESRTGSDRVAEAAEKLGLGPNDIIVNIQGDQPLLDHRSIDQLVSPFFLNPDFGMCTLVFKILNQDEIINPKDVKVTFDHDGFALYFSRSPIPFGRDPHIAFDTYKHLGVYAYTRRFLEVFRKLPDGNLEVIEKLEQLRALEYGHRIKVIVTEYDSPEVDLPGDISRIEKILDKKYGI